MVRDTARESLEAGPSASVREVVQGSVGAVLGRHGVADPDVRLAKVGGKLYVEIMGRAAPSTTIDTEHEIRQELERAPTALPCEIWLTLEPVPRTLIPVEAMPPTT